VWGRDAPGTSYGFESFVQHCYFSGFANRDVAFFHPASKSLIQADLLMNMPAREQYANAGGIGWPWTTLTGYFRPETWMHRKFAWAQGSNKEWAQLRVVRGPLADMTQGDEKRC
jgi:hypothetical protein